MNEPHYVRSADLPIGANEKTPHEARPRWHSRGYLQHVEKPGAIQHVTFHLADSLPAHVVRQLDAETRDLPPGYLEDERRKRVQEWIDAGHGSCILRRPDIAGMVQNALLAFDAERYRLLAWVVMPNHVHALFQPIEPWTVAKIVATWKKFTARRICDARRDGGIGGGGGRADREIGGPDVVVDEESVGVRGPSAGKKEEGEERVRPVWHREYWDRYIRDERHLRLVIDYIHANPVKAGLVAGAEEWRWSSAYRK